MSTRVAEQQEQVFIHRRDAAKMLGVSLNCLKEYERRGIIPRAYKLSKQVAIFDRAELINHIKSCPRSLEKYVPYEDKTGLALVG